MPDFTGRNSTISTKISQSWVKPIPDSPWFTSEEEILKYKVLSPFPSHDTMQHLRHVNCLTIKAGALYWQTFRAPNRYQTLIQRQHLCFTPWTINTSNQFWQSGHGPEGAAWECHVLLCCLLTFGERQPWVIPAHPQIPVDLIFCRSVSLSQHEERAVVNHIADSPFSCRPFTQTPRVTVK